ncbi:MAG: AMP-binding protein, partial [Candidatus Diapherotrites archaeon]
FDADEVLETVEREKCTALYGVPTMFILELNSPNFKKYDLSSLRTGVMAGAPCPVDTMRKCIELMHMKEITICYGLTEAAPVVTQTLRNDPLEKRVETVGRAHPNQEVKIFEPGTNKELPPNTPGELCVRGYNIMKGYYKMPDKTAEVIDKQGFLHTKDLATVDEQGYFRILGRVDDMIIRGGENVYPREVEEFLYTNPKVKDVAVVGVPSKTFGEEVMAYIILKDGVSATAEEIIAYCKENFSRYKAPKYVKFVDRFPLTASGKVQKFKLREMAATELGLEAKK